jgi:hypothetical protein
MEVTQTFIATSAAAGRRLSARTLAGWLSDLPLLAAKDRSAGRRDLEATRDAYAQQVPGAGHRLATAADCRPDRGPDGPGAFWHHTSGDFV